MLGFCDVELKAFGPLQLYVALAGVADKFKFIPTQTGALVFATGTGNGFTVADVVPTLIHPLTSVTVT